MTSLSLGKHALSVGMKRMVENEWYLEDRHFCQTHGGVIRWQSTPGGNISQQCGISVRDHVGSYRRYGVLRVGQLLAAVASQQLATVFEDGLVLYAECTYRWKKRKLSPFIRVNLVDGSLGIGERYSNNTKEKLFSMVKSYLDDDCPAGILKDYLLDNFIISGGIPY